MESWKLVETKDVDELGSGPVYIPNHRPPDNHSKAYEDADRDRQASQV